MIFSETTLIIVSALLGIIAACIYAYKRKPKVYNEWIFILLLTFVGFGICYGCINFTSKRIVFIMSSHEGSYTYHKFYAYNTPTIELVNGESIDTDELDLEYRNLYVFNCSNSGMLLYPIIYSEVINDRVKRYQTPDPIYIGPNCFDSISKMPDFWFCDPPQYIEQSNIIDYIVQDILGYLDIRWCVIPYSHTITE